MKVFLNTIKSAVLNIFRSDVNGASLNNLADASSVSSTDLSFPGPAEPLPLTPSAATEPDDLVPLWPPLAPSPSTRPTDSIPGLFKAFLLRNQGCADHYYEDATAFNAYSGFAAVADGMTVSSRSDLFADSLVRHFVQGEFYLENPEERRLWWQLCKREWSVQASRLFSKMTAEEQDQYTSGSGATFIGFWINPKRGACLYSIGDCCGLWFDQDRHVETVPEATQFNNSPNGVDTRQEFNAEVLVVSRYKATEDLPGDMLILCSDALAEYFLSKKPWEHQPDFWRSVEAMDEQEFGVWANGRKAARELKDDDYTFLMLRFPQLTSSRRVTRESTAVQPVSTPASADQKSGQPDPGGLPADGSSEVESRVEGDAKLSDDGHKNAIKNGVDVITQAVVHQQ